MERNGEHDGAGGAPIPPVVIPSEVQFRVEESNRRSVLFASLTMVGAATPLERRHVMRGSHRYWVYLLASRTATLYVGVTNDLERRVLEHKQGLVPGFTHRYGVNQLVYHECFGRVRDAIAREKQIKRWRREKKVALTESVNPEWRDLSEGWFI